MSLTSPTSSYSSRTFFHAVSLVSMCMCCSPLSCCFLACATTMIDLTVTSPLASILSHFMDRHGFWKCR